AREHRFEFAVITDAELLSAQIFVDLEWILGISPFRKKIGTIVVVPGEVVHRKIDKHENRSRLLLLCENVPCTIIEDAVHSRVFGCQLLHVEKMLDARGGMEAAGVREGSEPRIQAVGGVAAVSQHMRQSAFDMTSSQPGYRIGEAAVGAHGKPCEHVIFGIPA